MSGKLAMATLLGIASGANVVVSILANNAVIQNIDKKSCKDKMLNSSLLGIIVANTLVFGIALGYGLLVGYTGFIGVRQKTIAGMFISLGLAQLAMGSIVFSRLPKCTSKVAKRDLWIIIILGGVLPFLFGFLSFREM